MFCKHKWSLVSESVTESKFEHALRVKPSSNGSKITLPWQLCDAERKHIQVFGCDKCGRLRRFIEDI